MARRLQVVIDCIDPQKLTPFWTAALGYVLEPPPAGFDSWNAYYLSIGEPPESLPTEGDAADAIIDPDGIGPRIWFQPVPEAKAIKNRLHLDIRVGGAKSDPFDQRKQLIDAEAQRLVDLGATIFNVSSTPDINHYGIVMQDLEGNEFCLH